MDLWCFALLFDRELNVSAIKAFGIGSLPWMDPESAVAHVFTYYSDAPFIPQLPLRGPLSQMVSEPFQRYASHFDVTKGGTIRKGALDDLVELSSLSPRARVERLAESGDEAEFDQLLPMYLGHPKVRPTSCKAQLIGPATLFKHLSYCGRSIPSSSREGVALFSLYLEELERRLSLLCERGLAITFVLDEPALPYLGRNELALAIPLIKRAGALIRGANARYGLHCCGSTADEGVIAALHQLKPDLLSVPCALNDLGRVLALTEALTDPGAMVLGVCPTDGSIAEFDEPTVEKALRLTEGCKSELYLSASCGLAFSTVENAELVGKTLRSLCSSLST